jgi:hypothetical protein
VQEGVELLVMEEWVAGKMGQHGVDFVNGQNHR